MTTIWAWGFFLSEWAIRLVMLAVVPFRRTPGAAKGWLLLIFFEPWIGLLLYALIGRPTMPRSRVEQMARLPLVMAKVRERVVNHPNVVHPELSPELEWTGYLAKKLGRMPIFGGNAAEIMVDYDAVLARLAADIDQARNHVHLLYYIFVEDTATAPVIAALGRAAKRGVACRVLVDSLGSRAALPRRSFRSGARPRLPGAPNWRILSAASSKFEDTRGFTRRPGPSRPCESRSMKSWRASMSFFPKDSDS